jgi:hypothetical protein
MGKHAEDRCRFLATPWPGAFVFLQQGDHRRCRITAVSGRWGRGASTLYTHWGGRSAPQEAFAAANGASAPTRPVGGVCPRDPSTSIRLRYAALRTDSSVAPRLYRLGMTMGGVALRDAGFAYVRDGIGCADQVGGQEDVAHPIRPLHVRCGGWRDGMVVVTASRRVSHGSPRRCSLWAGVRSAQ